MEFRCPYCGCTSSHYNSRRMRYVCDMCGHSADDRQQQQERAEYHRAVASARSHLAAGNWQTVINILSPLLQSNPTDRLLYSLMLRASTADYTDYGMEASSMKSTACNCWDKLSRLGAIDGNMARYSKNVWQSRKDALVKKKNKVYFRTGLAVGSMLCSFSCLFANAYFAFFLLVLLSIFLAGSVSDLKPKELKAQIARIPQSSLANPFL